MPMPAFANKFKKGGAQGAPPQQQQLHLDQLEDLQTLRGMFPNGRPAAAVASRPAIPVATERKPGVWGQAMRKLDQFHYDKLAKQNATQGLYGDQRRDAYISQRWVDEERAARGEPIEVPRDTRRPLPPSRQRARTPTSRDYDDSFDAPRGPPRSRTPGPRPADYDDFGGPSNFGSRGGPQGPPRRGPQGFGQEFDGYGPQAGFGPAGQGFGNQFGQFNQYSAPQQFGEAFSAYPTQQFTQYDQYPSAFGPGAGAVTVGGFGGYEAQGYPGVQGYQAAVAPTVYATNGYDAYGATGATVSAYPTLTSVGGFGAAGVVDASGYAPTVYGQPGVYGGAQPYVSGW